jgi:hypothetical protein
MANPFSGLENIGQSYLAGLQLANQRQYREEAAAQRAEDTRVRQQYYTQMGTDREAALQERIKARLDAAASQFGQDLILNPQGEPDYAGSSLKRDRRLQSDTLAGAEGEIAAMYGTQPPLSPDIIGSPAYQAGRLRGTARTMADKRAENVALIRRGFVPVGQEQDQELPQGVINQIEGFSPDIFDGGGAPLTEAPMGTGAPSGGGQLVTINGRQYRAPAARALKEQPLGYEEVETPGGGKVRMNLTPERVRQLTAARLASANKEPGIFDDIDAAEKQLQTMQDKGTEEFNLERDNQGNVKVVKDQTFSIGKSPEQIQSDLNLEREKRATRRGIKTTGLGTGAPMPQGRNRVMDVRSIAGLPPIGRGRTNAPVAAPGQVRLPVDSLAPASSMSSEALSQLDPEELRQAMLEAQSGGMDPAALGLQLRQSLNQAGVPTAAGTNSYPLGLSPEQFDAILRMPRGRAPVEL